MIPPTRPTDVAHKWWVIYFLACIAVNVLIFVVASR